MTASFFVDTNIPVYFRDATEPEKQKRAQEWLEHLWRSKSGKLSYQVLNEYYVTVTRKLKPGLSPQLAMEDIRALITWEPIAIDRLVMENSWSIQERFGFSWWDSLIVAAAQILNCDFLLSEDLQHQQQIDELTIINPFFCSHTDKSTFK